MKRFISIIISLFMLNTAVYAAGFVDTKDHWAENTINRLVDRGIVNGVDASHFNPNGTVTRAEYLKMMMGLTGIGTVPYRQGECLDATARDWYAVYLQSALDKGLIPKEMIASYKANVTVTTDENGNTVSSVKYTGAFNGNLPIEREEMAALSMHLYQYVLNAKTMQGMAEPEGVDFPDMDEISVWAQPSVRLAVAAGFIEGMDDGTFQPRETATRAQAATILGRILDRQ